MTPFNILMLLIWGREISTFCVNKIIPSSTLVTIVVLENGARRKNRYSNFVLLCSQMFHLQNLSIWTSLNLLNFYYYKIFKSYINSKFIKINSRYTFSNSFARSSVITDIDSACCFALSSTCRCSWVILLPDEKIQKKMNKTPYAKLFVNQCRRISIIQLRSIWKRKFSQANLRRSWPFVIQVSK
jgi:hypothetical protein